MPNNAQFRADTAYRTLLVYGQYAGKSTAVFHRDELISSLLADLILECGPDFDRLLNDAREDANKEMTNAR